MSGGCGDKIQLENPDKKELLVRVKRFFLVPVESGLVAGFSFDIGDGLI